MRQTRAVALALAAWLVAPGMDGVHGEQPAPPGFRLGPPAPGTVTARFITPRIVEVARITAAGGGAAPVLDVPDPGTVQASAGRRPIGVRRVGVARRVVSASARGMDFRVATRVFVELADRVATGGVVTLTDQTGDWWAAPIEATLDPNRINPALHVSQVGYGSSRSKIAQVGLYLGTLGDLALAPATRFAVEDAASGQAVFEGTLSAPPVRDDPAASRVQLADFSALGRPGRYRLHVPGLGRSLPFVIGDGPVAAFARVYALGLLHQRCGTAIGPPFTRHAHRACHLAPAAVPTSAFRSVELRLQGMSSEAERNPRHTAPRLDSLAAARYPTLLPSPVDVSGGHHGGSDYGKYTTEGARLVHTLVFGADVLPGAAALDNLGIPESGNGRSDLVEIARWETEFLLRMQDRDGGFFSLVQPRDRTYEADAMPDAGDLQVVFPKTTASTAAATAALAQAASSPVWQQQFPGDRERYLAAAEKGWGFLERAWARYGRQEAYQMLGRHGAALEDRDEVAWAATEIFLATGRREAHDLLTSTFDPQAPDLAGPSGQRLFEGVGAAARSYAFAERTGRAQAGRLDPVLQGRAVKAVVLAGMEQARLAARSAYGLSLPDLARRGEIDSVFVEDALFDLAVAAALDADGALGNALDSNLAYAGGSNPANTALVTGLGWVSPREVAHQQAQNDRRALPPGGLPTSAIRPSTYTGRTGVSVDGWAAPRSAGGSDLWPLVERWTDAPGSGLEADTVTQARGLAVAAWLMASSPLRDHPWRAAQARIEGPTEPGGDVPAEVTLTVAEGDFLSAVTLWEVPGDEPTFAPSFLVRKRPPGPWWIEAEARTSDGRHAVAVAELPR